MQQGYAPRGHGRSRHRERTGPSLILRYRHDLGRPENVPRLCGEDGCVAVWLCGCVAVELRFVLEAAMSLDAMLGSRLAATEADAQ